MRELHNLPVREFQRVVLNARIVNVDLPKPCHLVTYMSFTKYAKSLEIKHIIFEGELCSGQEANSQVRRTVVNYELGAMLADGGKATRH
jgi:hypothetical protein